MKLVAGGILFLLLATTSAVKKVTHLDSQGRFDVTSTHIIKAGPGKTISAVLSDVRVHVGAKFKLEDGDEKTWIYESIAGGRFTKYDRDNEGDKEQVSPPIKIATETNVLNIKPRRFQGTDRIVVTYLTGHFRHGCLISQLDGELGEKHCDFSDDPLYPTASSCEIRKVCPADRAQHSTTKRCMGTIWTGDIGCKLNRTTVQTECHIDFEQDELELSSDDCPYPLGDVVDFFLDEEEVDSADAGRSSSRGKCRGWCHCTKSRGQRGFHRCLVCRHRICRGRSYLGK